jgi:hypothetical protein
VALQRTSALVSRFFGAPGTEWEDFEVKLKEALDSSDGRQKIVKILGAMANGDAEGVLILGVGIKDGERVLQSFPTDSEFPSLLMNMSRDRSPGLETLLQFTWAQYHGARLLRIDVKPAAKLTFFRDGDKMIAYRRVGSQTQAMSHQGVEQRTRLLSSRQSEKTGSVPSTEMDLSLRASIQPKSQRIPFLPSRDGRTLIDCKDALQPVFGHIYEVQVFDKSAVYRLESSAPVGDFATWEAFLKSAVDILELDERRFSYSVRIEHRVRSGFTVKALLDDVKNIEAVAQAMLNEPPVQELRDPNRFLPLVTGFAPCAGGFFWFEAEFVGRAHGWSHQRMGFVLADIPFDDEPFRKFFAANGGLPSFYDASNRLQIVRLFGDYELKRVRRVHGLADAYQPFIEADNPFFGKADEIMEQADVQPDRWSRYVVDHLCSMPRLLFQVAGGLLSSDRRFRFQNLEVTYNSQRYTTMYVGAIVHSIP